MTWIPVAQQLASDLVAWVFLLSGGAKLLDLRNFRIGLLYIPHMRVSWTYPIAVALPLLELALSAGLYWNEPRARWAGVGLLLLFCAVTALVMAARIRVQCNCFGGLGDRALSWSTLRDNALLIGLLLVALPLGPRTEWAVGPVVSLFILEAYVLALAMRSNIDVLKRLREQGAL